MLRTTLLAVVLAATGCHHDPKPMVPKEGELPPLPPASGTPVGYLIDSASQLALDDTQIKRLKEIDDSLAARNDGIETQLREIEKPEEEEPPAKNEPPRKPRNMAPGASPFHTTADAGKLHAAKDANNKDALSKAFEVLDDKQKTTARRLLDERGVTAPGNSVKSQPDRNGTDAAGVPLEP